MESYMAKTAAGALASDILHSYISQNLLFTNISAFGQASRMKMEPLKCFVFFFFLASVPFRRFAQESTWKTTHLCSQLLLITPMLLHSFVLRSQRTVLQNNELDLVTSNPLPIKPTEQNNTSQSLSIVRPLQCHLQKKKWHPNEGLKRRCFPCFAPISFPFPSTKPKWGLDTKPGPWVPNRFTLIPWPPFILLQSHTMRQSAPE